MGELAHPLLATHLEDLALHLAWAAHQVVWVRVSNQKELSSGELAWRERAGGVTWLQEGMCVGEPVPSFANCPKQENWTRYSPGQNRRAGPKGVGAGELVG